MNTASLLGRNVVKAQMRTILDPNQLYIPKDFEFRQRPKQHRPKDPFAQKKVNPLDHYKNYIFLSQWMTQMGRILHPDLTGLKAKNQRKLAKAIRRARAFGIISPHHKHPDSITNENQHRIQMQQLNNALLTAKIK